MEIPTVTTSEETKKEIVINVVLFAFLMATFLPWAILPWYLAASVSSMTLFHMAPIAIKYYKEEI